MNEVVIRRCTLRIVRHGGWSWGSNRRALLQQATSVLPRLIAERLAHLLDDTEGEIVEPIKVRVALSAAELSSGEALARAIATGLKSAVVPAVVRDAEQRSKDQRTAPSSHSAAESAQVRATRLPEAALPGPAQLLFVWRARGELWQRLQGLSFRAPELWLQALLLEVPSEVAQPESHQTLRQESAALRRMLPRDDGDPSYAARARLLIAVELAARHAGHIAASTLTELLDGLAPLIVPSSKSPERGPSRGAGTTTVAEAAVVREATSKLATTTVDSEATSTAVLLAATSEVKLCSVLPYIVLGILHRLGWFDVASATFRAMRDPGHGSIFAMALAYKLLPPPQRGWHRDEEVLRTAAAFAGMAAPPSANEFERWSREANGALSPLEDVLAAALARGHDLRLPLLITRVETRYDRPWLLFDADGAIPVAWERDEMALRRILRSFGPCVVLVSTGAADSLLMRGLADDGRSFVTTATPGRDDGWRRIRGTPCWAGGAETTSRRLTEAATLLPELEAQAMSVTRELIQRRAVAPARYGAELDHCAALTAATGLGSLAWTLWRDRETVHPLLSLERFGNLDGTARASPTQVEIRPAFGRRFLDLQKNGLLAEIPPAPWLSGRCIVFLGP